ncbi:MAG: HEAT repeat domain-containing protein [Planctomycetes bacterium]|nr:HEAT repeat domain-containing protein [Planctomycetota bacterium]
MIRSRHRSSIWLVLVFASVLLSGCVDGPFYSLWYRKQWLDDEKFGPTLFTRLEELENLRDEAGRMTEQQQAELARRLTHSVTEDASAVYRAEAARTLGSLRTNLAVEGLQKAAADQEKSVRIAACEAWGERGDHLAMEVLGRVLRSDQDLDVRMAAARELGKFEDPAAVQSLAVALDDSDPALQFRAIESLRRVTGEDFGNSIPAWRQFVRGEPVDRPEPPSIAQRLRTLF